MKRILTFLIFLSAVLYTGKVNADPNNSDCLAVVNRQLYYLKSDSDNPENVEYQPFIMSDVGHYDEIVSPDMIKPSIGTGTGSGTGSDDHCDNIRAAIQHMADNHTRMLRVFCTHYMYDQNNDHFRHILQPFRKDNNDKYDIRYFHLSDDPEAKCNHEWLKRLKAAILKAMDPDEHPETQDSVIIQLSLFDHVGLFGEDTWRNSVWNANNNNADVIDGNKASGNGIPYIYLTDSNNIPAGVDWSPTERDKLRDAERRYVQEIVKYTATYWNVMYEIMNEPGTSEKSGITEATPE